MCNIFNFAVQNEFERERVCVCVWREREYNVLLQLIVTIRFMYKCFNREEGKDVHSVIADPLFTNPEMNDWSHLSPKSPSIALGFEPINVTHVRILE